MKKNKNKKPKTKALKVIKTNRPKKNRIGQVFDPKTEKFLTGRPTVITKEILHKLEIAFGYGCSDGEACSFADIAPSTLYNFQNKYPEFLERKECLKQMPNLKARKVVVESMEKDPGIGQWWLEKKLSSEFGRNSNGTSIAVQINNTINKKKKDYGI